LINAKSARAGTKTEEKEPKPAKADINMYPKNKA
jgi:hypothetical protein